jgi:predicted DsbA family dithiol-disulfide isomerase
MTVTIEYFTDILCIWAWGGQVRIDQLGKELGNEVQLRTSSGKNWVMKSSYAIALSRYLLPRSNVSTTSGMRKAVSRALIATS